MASRGPGGRAEFAPPFEGSMRRLSRLIAKEFGLELDHDDLKRLGYRADKRLNNPNTYYVVPGVPKYIENAPRVVAYIRENISTKEGSLQLLGAEKSGTSHRRSSAPPTIPGTHSPSPSTAVDDSEAPSASTAAKKLSPPAASAAAKQASPTADDTADLEVEQDSKVAEGQLQQAPKPAGFSYAPVDKKLKVLEGLSQCINAYSQQKDFTAATLDAKGLQVMEEQRTLGERMRHAWVWWPGKTSEPLRCAQYMFCVRALLDVPACRQALGLPPNHKSAAAAAGSALLQRKRRSDALSPSPAAAAAGPARTAAGAAVAAALAHKRARTAASDGDVAPPTVADAKFDYKAAAGASAERIAPTSAAAAPAVAGSKGAVPAAAAAAADKQTALPDPAAPAEGVVAASLTGEQPAPPHHHSRPSAIDVLSPTGAGAAFTPAADYDDDDDDEDDYTSEADPEQPTSEAAAAANDPAAKVPLAAAAAATAGQQQAADVRSEAANSIGRASRRVRTPQGRFARKKHPHLPVVAAAPAARVSSAATAAAATPVAPAAAVLQQERPAWSAGVTQHQVLPHGRQPVASPPAAAGGDGTGPVTSGTSNMVTPVAAGATGSKAPRKTSIRWCHPATEPAVRPVDKRLKPTGKVGSKVLGSYRAGAMHATGRGTEVAGHPTKHKQSPAAAAAAAGRHAAPASPAAGAAVGGGGVTHVTLGRSKHSASAVADNLKVLEYIDGVITQLAEALKVATSFTPAVLASMPAVFTAGVSAPLQDFLTHGNTKHQALKEDRATCGDILASYKADQGYRKTYLAYRAALEGDAAAAAAWLNSAAQQEMLEKLRVLNEFKLRWEEQRRNEDQARLREEALRKKELELQAALEQLQREKELIAQQKEQQMVTEQQQQAQELGWQQRQRGGSAEGVRAVERALSDPRHYG